MTPFSRRAKQWEPKALALRHLAGTGSRDLLDPWILAPKVGLLVVDADDQLLSALSNEQKLQLFGATGSKWSGGVLPVELDDGMRICIINPTHAVGRRKSTLMEEISHVYLGHKPTMLTFSHDQLQVRDFDKAQEAEAFGVGAAALLPWHLLFHRVNDGWTRAEIAQEFAVTEDLVRYRIQTSGALNLFRARQRAA